jgi:cell division protein FtsW
MRIQHVILIPILLLFVMGLVMIFNTSSAELIEHTKYQNTHGALIRQIAYGVLGLMVGVSAYNVGYKRLLFMSPTLLVILSILLLTVFIPGLGISANGARRWISIFGISLQPSEFVKFAILLYFILRLSTLEEDLDLRGFVKILSIIGIPLGLILIEPNNGTVAVCVMALLSLFFLTRVPANFWALPMLCFGLVVFTFAMHMPYVRGRIEVYLHPELDLRGKGHQPYQAKIASGSGGLFGGGPASSMQKMSYLPEAQNDYIAAIFAEEYGFIGILLLIALYGWLAYEGLKAAFFAHDAVGLYVAAAFTFLLSLQAFLNLGVVSGLLPSTGLNLPFFSQGGSSLMANCAGIGVVMSVRRG